MTGRRNIPAESLAIHVGLGSALLAGGIAAIATVLRAWALRRSR